MDLDISQLTLEELYDVIRNVEEALPGRMKVEKAPTSLLEFAKCMIPDYKTPPHIQLLAQRLEDVAAGKIRRLMVLMPPRHGKTQLISKIFPAFYMGLFPQKSVICSTYGQELSDDMGRAVKNAIQSPMYKEIFPNSLMARDSASIRRFDVIDTSVQTTKKGQYFAVGVGSAITGRGADCAIIDDPIKDAAEADSALQRHNIIEWYKTTLYTRLMPNASMVVVQTRWHENDLAGYIIANKVEPWTVISLPALAEENDVLGRKVGEALWPEAFGVPELLRTRQLEGPRHWNALFQQRPSSDQGNIIKREWWVPWMELDPPKMEYIIQAYDTANAEGKDNDFTAVSTWGVFRIDGIPNVMLISVYNKKRDYQMMRREVTHLYNHYQPDQAVCEYKQSGITLVQDLQRAGIPILKFTPDSDKVARAHAVVPFFESGRVHYPQGKWWAEAMVDQCASFPFGKHDDMVDTMTLALLRLKQGFLLHAKGDPYAPEDDLDEDDDRPREERRQGYW